MNRALLAIALLALVPGCLVEADEDEGDDDVGEVASELKSGCVKSKFNCRLPDHPYDDKDRNRFFTQTGSIKWSIAPGTVAVDGQGHVVGPIASSQIEINIGQRKVIAGKNHVFGFRYTIAGNVAASAWVPESAVRGDTTKMPTIGHGNPGLGDGRHYVITGGDPKKYRDAQGRDYKISQGGTGNLEANDYLVRASGTVHMLYSVPGFQIGGLATDTLRTDKGTEFVRTTGVASITVPTTGPSGSGPAMKFIYGRVGNRWGWIAYDALRPK